MNEVSYSDIISVFALITAIGAFAWNIIRDLVMDKVAVEFSIAFGEIGNIKDTRTALFAPAGSLSDHKFDNPGVLLTITNIGRRPIGLASVGGKLRNGGKLFMAVDGLPKVVQPYEIFSSISNAKQNFLERIQKDEICRLWVMDTKGRKWLLSAKGWEQLKETAGYIASERHRAK
ncbi:MAG: hypothetical protein AAB518_02695 [Patescibacteria group bacterium]